MEPLLMVNQVPRVKPNTNPSTTTPSGTETIPTGDKDKSENKADKSNDPDKETTPDQSEDHKENDDAKAQSTASSDQKEATNNSDHATE
ncbi:Protein of unknown function [Lactobacillus hominis DSM 23910 = CRBIP 24.179]|uniref:Uncharacterized protein n=2 Tax=Lactobacillus hominis TaxID=1203033 RepID=I7L5V4_9LACO|nr:Protein of unknown function [Lactobacillus hominis DSM 23910 = CRBIP 24.179]